MKHTAPLTSSFITRAEYDDETGALDITFNNGRTYTYPGVPKETFEGLASADSAGLYFHTHINGKYG